MPEAAEDRRWRRAAGRRGRGYLWPEPSVAGVTVELAGGVTAAAVEAGEPEVGTAEAAALVALLVTELAAPVTALDRAGGGARTCRRRRCRRRRGRGRRSAGGARRGGRSAGSARGGSGSAGSARGRGPERSKCSVSRSGALEELGVADGAAAAAADPTAETAEPAALVAVDTALVTGAAALETAPVAAETSDCCPVPEEPAASAGLLARVKKVTPTRSSRQRRSLDIQG